jgi:hypothetical protein
MDTLRERRRTDFSTRKREGANQSTGREMSKPKKSS